MGPPPHPAQAQTDGNFHLNRPQTTDPNALVTVPSGFATPVISRPTTVPNMSTSQMMLTEPCTLKQKRHYARNKELYREHAAPMNGGDMGHQQIGLSDVQIGYQKSTPKRECGNLARIDQPKYVTAIPKYGGEIPKKTISNGLRFRASNELANQKNITNLRAERAISSKYGFMSRSKGLKIIPYVPNYQGHHPGVSSETVYGSSMGKASYSAQYLRERNPWCSLRARQRDPSIGLQYQRLIPGTQLRQDLSLANLPEEDAFARQYAAFETKVQPHELATMGWTKYISAPNTGLSYDPKYSISKNNNNDNKNGTRVGHGGGGKGDNNKMRQAGMSSHKSSAQLEAQRWQHQMWFSRDPACGSSTLGAMIRPM